MEANQTPIPDLVARLEALEKEATPGPWEWCRFDSSEGGEDGVHCPQDESAYVKPDGTWHTLTVCRGMTGPRKAQNAQFISSMRNALPQLLAELKRLQAEVANLTTDYSILSNDYVQLNLDVDAMRSANERMRAATKAYHDHVEQFMLVQDDELPTHEHWLEYTSLKLRLYAATGDDIDLRRAAEAVGDE